MSLGHLEVNRQTGQMYEDVWAGRGGERGTAAAPIAAIQTQKIGWRLCVYVCVCEFIRCHNYLDCVSFLWS